MTFGLGEKLEEYTNLTNSSLFPFHKKALPLVRRFEKPILWVGGILLFYLIGDAWQAGYFLTSDVLQDSQSRYLTRLTVALTWIAFVSAIILIPTIYSRSKVAKLIDKFNSEVAEFGRKLDYYFTDFDSVQAGFGQVEDWGLNPQFVLYTLGISVDGKKPKSIQNSVAKKNFFVAHGEELVGFDVETEFHQDGWGDVRSATSNVEPRYDYSSGKIYQVVLKGPKLKYSQIDFYRKQDAREFIEVFKSLVENFEIAVHAVEVLKSEINVGKMDNLSTRTGITWESLVATSKRLNLHSKHEVASENSARFFSLRTENE